MMALVRHLLVRPGLEALRDSRRPGEIKSFLSTRLTAESEICLSSVVGRRAGSLWSGADLSASAHRHTAEDQLLSSSRMIAEYERARCRAFSPWQGHRAQQGSIMCCRAPPYGYRYVKKTDTSAAYYEVVESEAEVVRLIFNAYTARPQHWCHCRLTQPTRGRDADATEPMERPTSGGCCQPGFTQATPSMAKPSFVRVGESHAASASVPVQP